VHKNYSSGIPVQISVYDDKLYIWNPGQLPDDWTIESLQAKHPSSPFNPLIANTFFRAGYIESWGRGIEKINRESKKHGVKSVDFNYELAGLMIQFTPDVPFHPLPKKGSVKGSVKRSVKTQDSILTHIDQDPKITIPDMAIELDISTRSIEKHIKILQSMGILQRIGPARGGHWKITPPSPTNAEGSEKSSEKSSEKTQDRILQLILENNKVSAQSIASSLNLSSRAIEKHLSQLKQQSILKRIGADRGGH